MPQYAYSFTCAGGGVWSNRKNLNQARCAHTATKLTNGQVLVAGGYNDGIENLATGELYDPATDTCTTTNNMHQSRDTHTATLLADGKVLVVGGYGSNMTSTASCEIYDPLTGNWTIAANLNTGRYNHTATLLNDGTVLVAGDLIAIRAVYLAASFTTLSLIIGPP